MRSDRAWSGWTLLALLLVTVVLLLSPLLWTVPAPVVVAAVLLLLAASPVVVLAVRRRGRGWAEAVAAVAVAGVALFGVTHWYQAPAGALRDVVVQTGFTTWPGAQPVEVSTCRYCPVLMNDSPHNYRWGLVSLVVDDVDTVCHKAIATLTGQGWRPVGTETGRCGAYLARPAPMGQTYLFTVEAQADDQTPGALPPPGRRHGRVLAIVTVQPPDSIPAG